jgi:hypothetical protein
MQRQWDREGSDDFEDEADRVGGLHDEELREANVADRMNNTNVGVRGEADEDGNAQDTLRTTDLVAKT